MGRKVFVVGVGMTKFEKPGSKAWDYPDMAQRGGHRRRSRTPAFPFDAVEQAAVGYCYGDSTCGERAVLRARAHRHPDLQREQQLLDGLDGAVHGQAVRRGRARRVRAGARLREDGEGLARREVHRPHQPDGQALQADGRAARLRQGARARRRCSATPAASTWSATAPRAEHFAKIGWKNHKHSVNNPYSQFQDEYTLEQILTAPMVYEPLTKLQCCPTSDGGGRGDPRERGLRAASTSSRRRRSRSLGMAMTTDLPSTFDEKSCIKLVGFDMTKKAAREGLRAVGPRPRERRRGRAARLLLVQRADHLRGARPLPGGQGRRVHRLRRRTPTAARSS